jgi:hypothetical protein
VQSPKGQRAVPRQPKDVVSLTLSLKKYVTAKTSSKRFQKSLKEKWQSCMIGWICITSDRNVLGFKLTMHKRILQNKYTDQELSAMDPDLVSFFRTVYSLKQESVSEAFIWFTQIKDHTLFASYQRLFLPQQSETQPSKIQKSDSKDPADYNPVLFIRTWVVDHMLQKYPLKVIPKSLLYPIPGSYFAIHYPELKYEDIKWQREKLLWISFFKKDPQCHLSGLPKELIKEICQLSYTPEQKDFKAVQEKFQIQIMLRWYFQWNDDIVVSLNKFL